MESRSVEGVKGGNGEWRPRIQQHLRNWEGGEWGWGPQESPRDEDSPGLPHHP